jgi:beta-lactam-binding protein with PASTA domain
MTVRRFLLILLGLVVFFAGGMVLADVVVMPRIIHRQVEVLVPEFTGLTLEAAQKEAHRLGLTVEVRDEVFDSDNPPGVVLEQFPPSLRTVRRGRPVLLVVSKGEALASVPDLTGMSLRQSELTLLREGLGTATVARTYDPGGPLGVVAQRPYPGREVPKGTQVALLVREGHERVELRMPDLSGQNLVRVRQELTRAGFEIGTVTYRPDPDEFPGVVLDQWPPAGTQIPLGGSIDLVASSRS